MNYSVLNKTDSGPNNNNETKFENWQVILQIVVLVSVMVLTLFGNSLVILCIYFKKDMRTVTGMFLAGLAISDLGVGLFCIPIALASLMNVKILENKAMCEFNAFCIVFFFIASINTLSATSIYKYITVVYPWRPVVTKRRAIYANVMIWTIAFSLAIGPIFGWSKYRLIKDRYQCSPLAPENSNEYSHMISLLLFGYLFPLATMTFCYSRVYSISKKHIRRMKRTSFGDQTLLLSETHLIKTLVIVLLAFLLCWLPFAVYALLGTLHAAIPIYLPIIAFYFGYSNSALNPLVFALRLRSFRRGFKDVLMMCLKRKIFTRAYFSYDSPPVASVTTKTLAARRKVSLPSKASRKGSLALVVEGSDNKAFVIDGPNVPVSQRKISRYRMMPACNTIPLSSDSSESKNGEHSTVFVIDIPGRKLSLAKCNSKESGAHLRNREQMIREEPISEDCNEGPSHFDAQFSDQKEGKYKIITLTAIRYEEFNKKVKICENINCKSNFGCCKISRCISTKYDIHVIKQPTNEEMLCYGDPCISMVNISVSWEDTTFDSLACVVMKTRHEGVKNKTIDVELLPLFMKEHVRLEM